MIDSYQKEDHAIVLSQSLSEMRYFQQQIILIDLHLHHIFGWSYFSLKEKADLSVAVADALRINDQVLLQVREEILQR